MKQIKGALEDIPYSHLAVIKNEIIQTLPWLLNNCANRELSELSKDDTLPIIYNEHLYSILSELYDYTEIYTDGFKMKNGIGAAVVFQDHVSMLKIPNFCYIYFSYTQLRQRQFHKLWISLKQDEFLKL